MGFNMRDLQKMQARMVKMQEDLQNSTFEGVSGGGAVTITMNGKYEVTAIKIDPETVDKDDISLLEDLVLTAFQDAFGKVNEAQQKMMTAMTGGMKLPPGMGF